MGTVQRAEVQERFVSSLGQWQLDLGSQTLHSAAEDHVDLVVREQAIPLDLFPSSILDGVSLVKTFTPDVPGDFAGGSVGGGFVSASAAHCFASSS